MFVPRRLIHVSMLVAILFFAASAVAAAPAPLHYQLKFERPNTHLVDVTVSADALGGVAAIFAMPDWAPGSYSIQNYAVNVQRFRAHSAEGRELTWRKTDSQTWRVELSGATAVTIDYQVYLNNLQNNVGQYNDRHAFLAGPATWMYLVGGKERPIELSIDVPSGWKVATGMEHTSDRTFRAENYDWFADAPLEISNFVEKDFVALGSTYHVIFHDVMGGKDTTQFTTDLQKIVNTIVPIFQPVAGIGAQAAPFKDYYFLFHVWPKSGGGLEHLNSTQINFSKDMDSTEPVPGRGTQYTAKLSVSSHEFFHAWNVKRLRPRPLGPFDYSQMVHTPSLWISEGLTSYYGSLALARAGLITPQQYLDSIAKLITDYEDLPGRTERSIEDTSWDTWFFGRVIVQDNNLPNTSYSYYNGGQIMGHILDFAIRQDTHNQKSLDDWMRLLYSRYALPKPGFEPDDAVHAASEVAGQDVSDIFRRYISGKDPIPYETYFAYAGISVEKKLDSSKSWAGIALAKQDNGAITIRNVIPGSPAESASLDKDDTIVALDGHVISSLEEVDALFAAHKPGDNVRVLVQRLGQMREFPLTLAFNPYYAYTLKPMEHPTPQQLAIYNSWLGIK